MKVAKIKKTDKKVEKIEFNEELTPKKFIITIASILLVLAVFYFITTLVVKPIINSRKSDPVQFDSSKITMGQLLSRSEKRYYALAVKRSEHLEMATFNFIELYNSYIESYKKKDNALNVYWIDMDDAFNNAYWGEELDIKKLIINDDVLFEIAKGKIKKYYVGHSKISEVLAKL